ncbi:MULTISPECIES: hypothetical protein [Pseudomonas]|jgi:hypothetical protein|uniref:Uncharacterized protein n=1 Tax=Pseudomonas helleri TaxID=1608996 RepID=A0A6A7ZBV0_9PSED|nr:MULTISPECIES: hypothetical protein [Pseudomonas]KMN22547.1 hypothetical protein TU85_13690 [Pseudomonas helleri]MQT37363.1 hypothetical protein [Pseudomonas helleri]MQT74527.1 hypothetical protein [Pseudomonas helleri]MQT97044.1 hypothetical protein [Pseudomonas helleri]MQU22438.1 hypothetical protein [Pseudomonas helleri]
MSTGFTEDEMRIALGLDLPVATKPVTPPAPPAIPATPKPAATLTPKPAPRAPVKRRGPMLRVTLHVSKVYDGEETVFIHDSKLLSQFDAEQEAKKALAKAGFKYFVVDSIVRVD